ncbi:Acid phosphatase [Termitomyces sp. T112]|nr:Acid phosphatase [Termitomyces sp. T112]
MKFSVLLALLATVTVTLGNDNGNDKDHKPHPPKVVKGKAFDRIIQIWLENIDYDEAAADHNLAFLAKEGLTLSNYFAVTHPSEPNYVAVVGGEYFGIDSDNLFNLPKNISSIVDLLEDKKISWAEYQEDMPSTGFTGFQFLNPTTGDNDYVRKHNPLIIFESVNTKHDRTSNIKNFTLFDQDLANNALPQWVFVTPNMLNDGHDTGITYAGNWTRAWLEPLLKNPNFNGENTLIMLTFDEIGTYPKPNRVFTVLLGNALPKHLIGKTDDNFYTHYSTIATIEANWNLHTLGRWDVGANVFEFVAEKTGDKVRKADISSVLFNASYPGIFHTTLLAKQPVPNTKLVVNGRTVLPAIQKYWASQQNCTGYHGQLIPPSLLTPPHFPKGC